MKKPSCIELRESPWDHRRNRPNAYRTKRIPARLPTYFLRPKPGSILTKKDTRKGMAQVTITMMKKAR